MLLRNNGSGRLITTTGELVDFRGAIPCCKPFEGGNTGWPLFSKEWVDYTQTQGRVNFYHARLGPFLTVSEPDWKDFGGAYKEIDGKADLDNFNDKFWNEVRNRVIYAGEKGSWVEIDLIDGWYCKHAQWSDLEHGHPWLAGNNIQNQDFAGGCGRVEIKPDDVYDRFLKKAVESFKGLGNIIWQDGNEIGQITGYNKIWSFSMRSRIQVHEKEIGLNVIHSFGTNSVKDEVMAADVDYIEVHNQFPSEPWFNKPTGMNEVNPAPDPDVYLKLYCKGRLGGSYIWYWRSEHSKDQMDTALSKISEAGLNNCAGVDVSACPYSVPVPSHVKVKPHGVNYYDSTPLYCNAVYCRQIGFDDGRICCPIRMEGDMFRAECELKAMGGEINWWLTDQVGDIGITIRNSGFQFLVTGNGSAIVHCSFPTAGGKDMCRNNDGTVPIKISK